MVFIWINHIFYWFCFIFIEWIVTYEYFLLIEELLFYWNVFTVYLFIDSKAVILLKCYK